MDNLENRVEKSKGFGKIEGVGRQVCLIIGIASQLYAWYLGFYTAGKLIKQEQYTKAAKYYAMGYIPGYAAKFLLAIAGFSYGKDIFKKIRRKKAKKKEA